MGYKLLDNVGVLNLRQDLQLTFQQFDKVLILVHLVDRHDLNCYQRLGVILNVATFDDSEGTLTIAITQLPVPK
jgi:hypothetical protein